MSGETETIGFCVFDDVQEAVEDETIESGASTNLPYHGFTIHVNQLPKYKKFQGKFCELIDPKLAKLILENKSDWAYTDPVLHRVTYPQLANAKRVFKNKDGQRLIKYHQTAGVGRFYGDSLVDLPRVIKHTMFKRNNYIDIDMVKGHPTIILELAKQVGISLPHIQAYVSDPQKQFRLMEKHYGPIGKDTCKYLYNQTIYGGSHNGWVKSITEPSEAWAKKASPENRSPIVLKTTEPRQFEVGFKKECVWVAQQLWNANPSLREQLAKKHKSWDSKTLYEKQNCLTSYALQAVENHSLYSAYEYLESNDYFAKTESSVPIVSLEKDGLCFPPSKVFDSASLVDELNAHTLQDTGLAVTWAIKPYNNVYNELLERVDVAKDAAELYLDQKEEFEEHVALIESTGDYIVDKFGKPVIVSQAQLTAMFRHVQLGVKPNGLNRVWLNDPDKRSVTNVGTYPPPMVCPEGHYNLWTPYQWEDIPPVDTRDDDVHMLLEHIQVMCGNDTEVFDYFMTMLSFNLNKPAEKTGVFPIFSGAPGCGKGTLFKLLERLVGKDKYLETSSPEQDVWGTFNMPVMGKQFVVTNELGKLNQVGFVDKIKAFITDPNIVIQGKGTNQTTMVGCHQLFGASNSKDPVNAEKGQRRMFVISSSPQFIGDHDYFDHANEIIEDDEVICALFHWIRSIDCSKFRHMKMPITEQMEVILEASIPVIHQFLIHLAEFNPDTENVKLPNRQLMEEFNTFKELNCVKYECSSMQLSKQIMLETKGLNMVSKFNTGGKRGFLFRVDEINSHFKLGCQVD